jgi:dolichol-phosphate mannosyltransferase
MCGLQLKGVGRMPPIGTHRSGEGSNVAGTVRGRHSGGLGAGQTLSIVLPAYNEEENIAPLAAELARVVSRLPEGWGVESLFVDDGSADGTRREILEARRRYPELAIRVIALDRNWGLTAALDAGIREASGEVVATMDTDLQNDPADLPMLLEHLEGADVVVGIRLNRRDGLVKRLSSKIANAVRNRVTHEDVVDTGCSLKVFRRAYLSRIKLYTGLHRFLPTLLKLEGARVVQVRVNHRPRIRGTAKYHLWNRLVGPLIDLFAVRWMQKRHMRYRAEEIL